MNQISILLFISIVPVLLISIYVYNKDKNKEPIKLLLILFGLGILSCFMVLEISNILSKILPFMNISVKDMNFLEVILYSFLGIALVEESCKWIMVYFFGYNSKEFDETYDILVYAVFVSLGFAFFENAIYVFDNQDIRTALFRPISAIPGHTCDAIFMGYYLSMAKQFHYQGNRKEERNNIYLSIGIPTILHGIYDFCLMSGYKVFVYTFIVFIVILYIISLMKLKKLSEENKKVLTKHLFCSKCGGLIEGRFCQKCGSRQD